MTGGYISGDKRKQTNNRFTNIKWCSRYIKTAKFRSAQEPFYYCKAHTCSAIPDEEVLTNPALWESRTRFGHPGFTSVICDSPSSVSARFPECEEIAAH